MCVRISQDKTRKVKDKTDGHRSIGQYALQKWQHTNIIIPK